MLRKRWQTYADEIPHLPTQADQSAEQQADRRYLNVQPRHFNFGSIGNYLPTSPATVAKLHSSSTDLPSIRKTVTFSESPSVNGGAFVGADGYNVSMASDYAWNSPMWSPLAYPRPDGILRSLGHVHKVPVDGRLYAPRAPAAPLTANSHREAIHGALHWSDRRRRAADMLIVQTLASEDFVDSLIERCVLQEATAIVKETVCSLVWDHVEVRPLTDLIQRLVDELIREMALSELRTDVPPAVLGHHDLIQEEVSALAADLFTDALQTEYFLTLLSAHEEEYTEAQTQKHDFGETFLDSLILDVLLREVIHITDA